jgi:hypothetical protein
VGEGIQGKRAACMKAGAVKSALISMVAAYLFEAEGRVMPGALHWIALRPNALFMLSNILGQRRTYTSAFARRRLLLLLHGISPERLVSSARGGMASLKRKSYPKTTR